MKKARVLIVDDAMLIRRIVSDALAAESSIEVVGEAANGRIALQKIPQLTPDLVTLDIEMPEMDGLATLKEIRKGYPRLPVIMFSALTERGAADTLEALHNGASDYVTKPASAGGKELAQRRIREDLIPKIRSLCRIGIPAPARAVTATGPTAQAPLTIRAVGPAITADVIAVALSTGGPTALEDVFSRLPADFPVPIVLVQHMPQMFTRFLAERLNGRSPLTVVEASEGTAVKPGVIYVAPGDFHVTLHRRGGEVVIALDQNPPENSHRPAADVLFRSVAAAYGSRALGLVMTGMGQDGLRGCEEITRAGGRVIVQDEASSVVWEMPGRVAQAGLADAVLPLGDMAMELMRRAGCGAAARVGAV